MFQSLTLVQEVDPWVPVQHVKASLCGKVDVHLWRAIVSRHKEVRMSAAMDMPITPILSSHLVSCVEIWFL